ncbi:hypothetical protein L2D08_07410 [Domibacillus sp. PGB-M46]|uniref:hypothetical protein n=1 Tax=Domibacillus sp. PGB-M46 TaxID=2910255 RepID=UPI001F561752|nr:hypothetical protein [Domibacillus sp. PGB-M46]MCI2254189.1 hypothetical protein [Domibacillus sp. PGB-M46]
MSVTLCVSCHTSQAVLKENEKPFCLPCYSTLTGIKFQEESEPAESDRPSFFFDSGAIPTLELLAETLRSLKQEEIETIRSENMLDAAKAKKQLDQFIYEAESLIQNFK